MSDALGSPFDPIIHPIKYYYYSVTLGTWTTKAVLVEMNDSQSSSRGSASTANVFLY